MQRLRRILATIGRIVACGSLAAAPANAQLDGGAYWATLGIGTGTLASTSTAASVAVWYRAGPHLVGARLLGVDTGGDPFKDPLPLVTEAVSEQALLYGRGVRGRRSWWSVSGGLGHLTWHRETTRDPLAGEEQRESGSAIGLAAEAQLFWTRSTRFGVGLTAFANINGVRSVGGGLLAVYFGRLR